MGYTVHKRPQYFNQAVTLGPGASEIISSESITASSMAQTLSQYGVSFITYGTSGKTSDIILPPPPGAGTIKYIFVVNNTRSVELNINTDATTLTFWGTTFNTANLTVASTGSPSGTPKASAALMLIGASTLQWAVAPGSTFKWEFVASTGSTATA